MTTSTPSSSSSRYRRSRPNQRTSPPPEDPPSSPSTSTTSTSSKPSTDPLAQEKAELKEAVHEQAIKTSNSLSVLDVLRILGGIVLLVCGTSYLSTSGESMTWGWNGRWTRAREWKALFQPRVSLSDADLLAYDGTDATKPIYLALNGTIYDVSASPATYGPGGSYHFFAGHDAARAFLTGCFADDLVPDLRGVERMYIPVDPETKDDTSDEVKAKASKRKPLSSAERKNRDAREKREARKAVVEGLEGWHRVFRGDTGRPYRMVGQVKRDEGWLDKLPVRELCEKAEKGRPVRKYDD